MASPSSSPKKRQVWLVFAHFDRERLEVASRYVGRVAGDDVEASAGEWFEQFAFEEIYAVGGLICLAFWRAILRAAGEMSVAVILALGKECERAMAMAPEPVPMSAISICSGRDLARSMTSSTKCSVSGRWDQDVWGDGEG